MILIASCINKRTAPGLSSSSYVRRIFVPAVNDYYYSSLPRSIIVKGTLTSNFLPLMFTIPKDASRAVC